MKRFERIVAVVALVGSCYVASAAVDIDLGRQLFVDDFLVESTQGVTRVCNHPTKAFDASVVYRVAYHGKVACKT